MSTAELDEMRRHFDAFERGEEPDDYGDHGGTVADLLEIAEAYRDALDAIAGWCAAGLENGEDPRLRDIYNRATAALSAKPTERG